MQAVQRRPVAEPGHGNAHHRARQQHDGRGERELQQSVEVAVGQVVSRFTHACLSAPRNPIGSHPGVDLQARRSPFGAAVRGMPRFRHHRRSCPPAPGPAGRARRRISASWAWAAICWATIAVWMPWNSPSSQPTSWAWAMRSSPSLGTLLSSNGSDKPGELVAQLGGQAVAELLDGVLVDLAQPVARGLVERRRPYLLEQLLDHRADAHDLGRLLDHVGEVALVVVLLQRLAVGRDEEDRVFGLRLGHGHSDHPPRHRPR